MNRMPIKRGRAICRWGLSTAEVAISTLLIGLVSVSALQAVGGVFRTRTASSIAYARTALAQSLLTEIVQSQYQDEGVIIRFGPETGEQSGTRKHFDDVDDYHNWLESPPCDKESSNGIDGYQGWSRAAQVAWVEPGNPQATATSNKGLKRITITVVDPTGRATTHVAYRSQWGALQQTSWADTTPLTYVGSELDLGGSIQAYSGTNLTNHVQEQ